MVLKIFIRQVSFIEISIKLIFLFPFDSTMPAFYLDFGLVVDIDSEQKSEGVKALQEQNFSIKKQTIDRNADPLRVLLERD